MKAIILAGGKGSRLQSVVADLPKPLAPVQGQPFLYILIRFLKFHKIDEIIISAHHLAEEFEAHLGAIHKLTSGVSLVKEPAPLGTGGAVRFICKSMNPNEYVLVLNGDTFFDFDLFGFMAAHRNETAIALKNVNDSSRYGTVEVDKGKIIKFAEKAPGSNPGVIYAGYSIIGVSDILKLLPDGNSSLESDFFPLLLERNHEIKGEAYDGEFIDIGIPEDYRFANISFDFSKFA